MLTQQASLLESCLDNTNIMTAPSTQGTVATSAMEAELWGIFEGLK
jgi:hypothetical protein